MAGIIMFLTQRTFPGNNNSNAGSKKGFGKYVRQDIALNTFGLVTNSGTTALRNFQFRSIILSLAAI